jgi:hypothetical protein
MDKDAGKNRLNEDELHDDEMALNMRERSLSSSRDAPQGQCLYF